MDSSKLQSIELFDGLSAEQLERCASMFEEFEILAGKGLTREGDFSYKFFVVLDGEVTVLRDFNTIAVLGPGDFFGEMGILTGERRNARVVGKTRCTLAGMMSWDFRTITEELPALAGKIQAAIDERAASLADDSSG